jgi:hypothetical protein
MSLSELDAIEDTTTPIQRVLQEVFTAAASSTDARQKQQQVHGDTRLWVDKYGMQHGLVGSKATRVCQELVEYINHWRKARQESMDKMAERHRKLQAKYHNCGKTPRGKKKATATKKRKKTTSKGYGYNEDDWLVGDDDGDYSDDDDENNTPLCVLVGPSSSGKTSMVHHVAKLGNCSVVEINTTRVRGGAALKQDIEEATRSLSSMDMLKKKQQQQQQDDDDTAAAKTTTIPFFDKFVKKPSKALVEDSDSDSDDDESRKDDTQTSNESSMTIVLIDEVDILYDSEGDAGFWAALSSLAKTARTPIILTANRCPPQLLNNHSLPYRLFELERPTPEECSSKLLQICRHEGIPLTSAIRQQGSDHIQETLSLVGSVCDCDLRKMIYELQIFTQTPGTMKSTPSKDASSSMDEETSSDAQDNDEWRPAIHSLEPSKIPMETYSILTVKGKNFRTLASLAADDGDNDDFSIWIGDEKCRKRVIDDQTMIVLCPPYDISREEKDCDTFCSRLMKRVAPLTIDCPSMGLFKSGTSRTVKIETMVNGLQNTGISWLSVEYEYPTECSPEKKSSESDDEIEDIESDEDGVDSQRVISSVPFQGLDDGLSMWKKALSEVAEDFLPKPRESTTQSDRDIVALLQNHAEYAHNASDASFLEDFQNGIPYLAGACKGFGFDYTEDAFGENAVGDKLRMHENSRP